MQADGEKRDAGPGAAGGDAGGGGALRRTRYRFVGQVQGVGFRWTSSRIAGGLGLTGWVRNEYDGSVTCVLQGTDAQIGAFFSQLADMMHTYASYAIDSREDEGIVAGERDFRVRY